MEENLLPKIVKLGGNPLLKPLHMERDHYLQISLYTSHYMEAVFSTVRKIYGKQPGDPMEDLNVNLDIWGMFMNATLRAAVHLGKDHDTNL